MLPKAFGAEYAWSSKWTALQRWYISIFGVVDLPTRIRARALIPVVAELSFDHFLDLGAGTGVYSFFLTRNSRVEGLALDIDPVRADSIKHAAKLGGRRNLDSLCGNEDALGTLCASTYSLVLAIEVLQYLSNLDKVFVHTIRCLRPGGTFIAHIPIREEPWVFQNSTFDETRLCELLVNAGFERPCIRPTFGSYAVCLSEIFTWFVNRPLLLALCYPILLFAATLKSSFVRRGAGCLIIARKPQ